MSDERTNQNPPPTPASGSPPPPPPNTTPAKEEVATDVSEVARARLEGTDKTETPPSVAADASDAAKGVAGTPADDSTAAKVEAAPNATAPTAASTDGGSKTAPLDTKPAGTGAPTQPPAAAAASPATAPVTAAGGGNGAATRPAAAGSAPASAAPTSSGGPVANPDTTAKAPTAADAAPTAAGAAAATAEAETKPSAPAATAAPAAKPAAAAKPGGKPAAPPKPPEPDPDEVTALRELVPDLTWERRHGYLEVRIPSQQIIPVARAVKGLGYDYLSAITAVDWRDRVEMLYHCYGWDYVETPGCMVIRADLPPEPNPLCPSLTAVWTGAELQEREIYDLFGVKFIGHPDLRRILLDDNFPGHPLRKDWTFDYEYVLVRHLKYGAEGQDAPPGGGEGFRRV